ncbi:unnamed protein product [Pleuronectes platessa]|uniref:Uncharacterized protein n=1 Tax=Pleuronectes platessa TaxID=8262 RepID=A0A9N7TUT2_PLEPL|nr:unnamed protein product [Pleuronectes platessa]
MIREGFDSKEKCNPGTVGYTVVRLCLKVRADMLAVPVMCPSNTNSYLTGLCKRPDWKLWTLRRHVEHLQASDPCNPEPLQLCV